MANATIWLPKPKPTEPRKRLNSVENKVKNRDNSIPAFREAGIWHKKTWQPKNNNILTREEFKYLFDQHFDPVRNYLYYRSGDKELATDLAQETFLKLWEKQIPYLNGNAKPLLYKIAGDLFVNEYRKNRCNTKFVVASTQTDQTVISPEQIMQFEQTQAQYESALTQLSENLRTVFLMHRMEGLKYKEIATLLGLSQKAVEKRMGLALDFLRKVIERE